MYGLHSATKSYLAYCWLQKIGPCSRLQSNRLRQPWLQDVLNHCAVIVFPYQSYTMMLTELYRANVPMLAQSRKFLLQWELDHECLFERVYGLNDALSETGALPALH